MSVGSVTPKNQGAVPAKQDAEAFGRVAQSGAPTAAGYEKNFFGNLLRASAAYVGTIKDPQEAEVAAGGAARTIRGEINARVRGAGAPGSPQYGAKASALAAALSGAYSDLMGDNKLPEQTKRGLAQIGKALFGPQKDIREFPTAQPGVWLPVRKSGDKTGGPPQGMQDAGASTRETPQMQEAPALPSLPRMQEALQQIQEAPQRIREIPQRMRGIETPLLEMPLRPPASIL